MSVFRCSWPYKALVMGALLLLGLLARSAWAQRASGTVEGAPPRASAPVGPAGDASAPPPTLGSALLALGATSRPALQRAIEELASLNDPAAVEALEALGERRLRRSAGGRLLILDADGPGARDALSGERVSAEQLGALTLSSPPINNAVRRSLAAVLAQLRLRSPNVPTRLVAAKELLERPQQRLADPLREALGRESNPGVRKAMTLALAVLDLERGDASRRIEAIETLGGSGKLTFKSTLETLLARDEAGKYTESDEGVRRAAARAIDSIEQRQRLIGIASNSLYGLSLGSVLVLAALGLAITFGVMGVINMAHGEMLMLGAYATYVVQNFFRSHLPGWFDWYIVAAVPIAFAVTALVGMVLERGVIRYLYGRPLETLLATWGISLLLIQSVRLIFGAQNVEIVNPSWLSGGVNLVEDVVFPYSRLAIIGFALAVLALIGLLLQRTRLGLNVRAVTQNRAMAACMGLSTRRVDLYTFALGSGVAGLGGVALSQIGNVGPELGQGYIVDSFMVVVLGGVGKIAGTAIGGFGLGIISKYLEPVVGAVLGKILVLIFVILFIQKRPQGLFALRSRELEAG